MTPRKNRGILTYLLIIVLAISCIYFVSTKLSSNNNKTEYTTIISYFDNYEVSYYELDLGTGELVYQLRGDETQKRYSVPNVERITERTTMPSTLMSRSNRIISRSLTGRGFTH